jgi:hypothetical protein
MKRLMILGGLMGFCIGVAFGLVQGSAWPSILWRACAATYAAGLLMRWWGRVWIQGLQQSYQERLAISQLSPAETTSNRAKS